jgi:hypothetical protein
MRLKGIRQKRNWYWTPKETGKQLFFELILLKEIFGIIRHLHRKPLNALRSPNNYKINAIQKKIL